MHKLLWLLILLLFSTGCSSFVKDGQPIVSQVDSLLEEGRSAGQTFTARDAGFAGIEVFLAPETPGDGEIRAHLRSDSQSSRDLAVVALPVNAITVPGFYRFAFAAQDNSRQRDYYLLLDVVGTGAIRAGSAAGDAYLDGALYQDDAPRDAQLAFRLVYEPVGLFVGLLTLAGTWIIALAVALFLFVLPGWALLTLLLPGWTMLSCGERLGLASSVSLAIYPLLFLWTDLAGLHLGSLYAWMPALAAGAFLVWRNRMWRPGDAWRAWRQSEFVIHDVALAALIALIFIVRFWVIRSLDAPMWGDSYQDTVITQLFVDRGGLFNSWQPYADMVTFTYHFGFHSAAAVFHWFSGMEVSQSVLWTGQLLNGLSVIALYPLAVRVGKNRWAGVGAVLVAGLLSQMPMAYVNWGRYTQLAGQVILPGAVIIAWMALEVQNRDWKLIALAWIAWGGLALTHYRVLIFAVPFFASYLLFQVRQGRLRTLVTQILLMGIGAGLLFLPWFIHTFDGRITLGFAKQLTTPADATSAFTQEYNSIGDLATYLPIGLWLLFPLGIGWGLWRREKGVAWFSLWWLLVLLAANPQWLRLPGEGALSNFAVFIAAYIPVGVILGVAVGWMSSLSRRWIASVMFLVLLGGIWGARLRLDDPRVAQSELVTRPDLRAAAWIRENTPKDARFLVNTFFAYGEADIVGSDGGWWLPLVAQRQTMLPPLNYGSERGPSPDYRRWINLLPIEIQKKGLTDPDIMALLNERGITYVYIGQRQGRVNYDGKYSLRPEELLASARFRPIYHQDRVWVFELVR